METSALLDLYKLTEEVLYYSSGGILVHCSGGVGRTGTFIGLYKLIKDYQNVKVYTHIKMFTFEGPKIQVPIN